MAYAKMESTPTSFGRGRFVVSEGVAPSEKILPDEDLPTLFEHDTGAGDEFFDIVLLKGTIVSSYQKTDGRYVATYCRGISHLSTAASDGGNLKRHRIITTASGAVALEAVDHAVGAGEIEGGFTYVRDTSSIIDNTPNLMGEAGVDGVTGSLGQAAKPFGVLAKDAFRPFDKGDNEGVSFITHGYVEWPLVRVEDSNSAEVFNNTDLVVGSYVKPDALGRPVLFREGIDPEYLRIGQVIAREDITATGFSGGPASVDNTATYDYGYLKYMQLPVYAFDADMLKKVYSRSVFGVGDVFGVRANLSAADWVEQYDSTAPTYLSKTAYGDTGVYGAVRVNLMNL